MDLCFAINFLQCANYQSRIETLQGDYSHWYYELDGKEFIAGQMNRTYNSPSAINPDEFVMMQWALDEKKIQIGLMI